MKSLQDQSDDQLKLALKVTGLARDEREQIRKEIERRQEKIWKAEMEEREAKEQEAKAQEARMIKAARQQVRVLSDAELVARLSNPDDVAQLAFVREEIERRKSKALAPAKQAACRPGSTRR